MSTAKNREKILTKDSSYDKIYSKYMRLRCWKRKDFVMGKDKYVAYVSTYTMGGDQYGIKIYDVDLKNGRFIPKDQVEITNSSYVTISHSRKFLYSITDFGIEAYKIEKRW